MSKILIIDDDLYLCDILSRAILKRGYQAAFGITLKDGMRMASQKEFDVIMLDVQLPDGNGIKKIPEIMKLSGCPDVIIMTGVGDPDGAELSIESGAWDYIEKPASVEAMMLPLIRVLEYRKEKKENKIPLVLDREGIIGDSPAIKRCLDLVSLCALSDVNVLITGETGTGKELLSRAIHNNSNRSDNDFIVLDCSSIPENLIESLLFGHVKGSFTGAEENKTGLVKQADNGTLFLDEVGELPLNMQKSFLRVLQEQSFRPVGSKKEVKSNFRLVAATNRDLEKMVLEGTFRKDLLYRLNSFIIQAPLLKERKEDILNLTMYFLSKICRESDKMSKGFSPDFIQVLNAYDWPGNIRELLNTLQSSFATAVNETILYSTHLPVHIRARAARSSFPMQSKKSVGTANQKSEVLKNIEESSIEKYKLFREKLIEGGEKEYFTTLASISEGKAKKACEISGLSRSRFYYFIKKYEIDLSTYTP